MTDEEIDALWEAIEAVEKNGDVALPAFHALATPDKIGDLLNVLSEMRDARWDAVLD